LGFDARVGFGFDKSRSNSRCWNKVIYAWEGLKKNCCTKTASMNSIIDTFEELELQDDINYNNINNKIEVLESRENLNINQIEINDKYNNNIKDNNYNKDIDNINTTEKYKNCKKKIIFYGNGNNENKDREKDSNYNII
jgi:hypothetical protein